MLPLHLLPREHEVLEDQVVGHRARHQDQIGLARLQHGVHQAGLRRLQVAAVAAPALDVEHQVVSLQEFRHVRLQGDQIGRVLRVAANRDGSGHVAVHEPERPAEQVDSRRDHGRADALVVQHQRLDQVVDVAAVVRDVHDAPAGGCGVDAVGVLGDPLDHPEDRVERVLQRPVDRVALAGAQLLEVVVDPPLGLGARVPVAAVQIGHHFVPGQDGSRDLVELYVAGHGSLRLPRRGPGRGRSCTRWCWPTRPGRACARRPRPARHARPAGCARRRRARPGAPA